MLDKANTNNADNTEKYLVIEIFRNWLKEQNWEGVFENPNILELANNSQYLVDSTEPCGMFWVDTENGLVEDPFCTLMDNLTKPLET